MEYWDDDGSEIDCDFPSDPPTEEDMCSTQTHRLDSVQRAVVWWVVVFTTVFETLHSLPLRAIQWLLKFLLCVLTVMGMFSPKINHVADAFPGTISRRSQYLQNVLPVPSITNMVVCQSCHSIFSFEACVERRGLHLLPQPCINCLQSHIRSPLFREVVTTKGARKIYPLCAYLTCSLIKALTSILSRPGIFELCEEWRT